MIVWSGWYASKSSVSWLQTSKPHILHCPTYCLYILSRYQIEIIFPMWTYVQHATVNKRQYSPPPFTKNKTKTKILFLTSVHFGFRRLEDRELCAWGFRKHSNATTTVAAVIVDVFLVAAAVAVVVVLYCSYCCCFRFLSDKLKMRVRKTWKWYRKSGCSSQARWWQCWFTIHVVWIIFDFMSLDPKGCYLAIDFLSPS